MQVAVAPLPCFSNFQPQDRPTRRRTANRSCLPGRNSGIGGLKLNR